jgi:3-dehydroquinate synthase
MTVEDFMRNMARDKKVVSGRIRLVLLKAIGEAKLVFDYPDDVLKTVLESAAT